MTGSSGDGWQILSGGSMATVARRAGLVRRSTGFWTPAVHALLRHVAASGFDRAPEVRGIDEEGRELLTYLPGRVPDPRDRPHVDATTLMDAGRLLCRFHDATAGFPIDAMDGWDPFFREPDLARPEVICHNDFAFYNCVYVDRRPWGMIDFDAAAPGSRLWDLAGTACGFTDLGSGSDPADVARQLEQLCAGYGNARPAGLVSMIGHRLRHSRSAVRAVAGTDAPQAAGARMAAILYGRRLRAFEAERSELERHLGRLSSTGRRDGR